MDTKRDFLAHPKMAVGEVVGGGSLSFSSESGGLGITEGPGRGRSAALLPWDSDCRLGVYKCGPAA